MQTTQSPFGLYNVMRFVASVEVANGDSYGTALYASTKSDPALVENTQVLIEVVSGLHKSAEAEAVSRPVTWRAMNGAALPNEPFQLVMAIVNHGQTSFEHADFVVEWKNSLGLWTGILIELGDYFTILGTTNSTGLASERHKRRLRLAHKAIVDHFRSERKKKVEEQK